MTDSKSATLTRKDLVKKLTLEFGSATLAKDFVTEFFAEAERLLVEEGKLKLHNFGTFETANKKTRVGRNPLSGQEMQISARKVVRFRPSSKLRDAVRHAETTDSKDSEDI